jgi:inner membrane protein
MDTITHIALGACMGEAFAGKTVGKKAMLWGVAAHGLPDIDFLAAFWLDSSENLLAHRGFTHSILFLLLGTPFLAYAAYRLHRTHDIPFKKWWLFMLLAVGAHLFIDAFNNYGVGWLEPFSHKRFSFNSIYVVDPFFSIVPALASVMLVLVKRNPLLKKWLFMLGLLVPAAYLLYSFGNKWYIERKTKRILTAQKIPFKKILTTPAPMQTWLWYVAAETDSGFYSSYRSVFDNDPQNIPVAFDAKNLQLTDAITDTAALQNLVDFSQGFYTLQQINDTILINDLRFGKIIGWYDINERFAFYFYLQPDADNALAVQRGRFAKWDEAVFKALIRRIRGN